MSLIELLTVMIAGAALMSVAIAALVALKRADQRFARRLESQGVIAELAEPMRDDVRAAKSAAWNAESNELQLEGSGERVTYRLIDGRWERWQGDALAGAFRLPDDAACQVTISGEDGKQLVRMTLEPQASTHDAARRRERPIEIVALVGRDRELLYP
jgi:hypothetical protein